MELFITTTPITTHKKNTFLHISGQSFGKLLLNNIQKNSREGSATKNASDEISKRKELFLLIHVKLQLIKVQYTPSQQHATFRNLRLH